MHDNRRGAKTDEERKGDERRDGAHARSGDPVTEGLAANTHQTSRAACPYPEGSEKRQAWLDAWDEAERKAQTIW